MNDVFLYLNELKLQDEHFDEEVEFLIDDFLPKKLITMYYADGGNGKSWLAQGITKHLLEKDKIKNLTYIDFDNPVSVLKERNINELLIKKYKKLNYIQRSTLNISPFELLMKLEEHAYSGAYDDCVFLLDSLRNIVDIMHDGKVMRVMNALMNMREAGATIIILHHSNKDGKNYQGSNNIRNSIDCMYRLNKRPSGDDEINFLLDVQKERAGINDCAFCVKTESLELREMDFDIACMNEYELEFVDKVKKSLSMRKDGLNKTELLEATGHKKDDKTARDTLDKFTDKFWKAKKQGNRYIYSLN